MTKMLPGFQEDKAIRRQVCDMLGGIGIRINSMLLGMTTTIPGFVAEMDDVKVILHVTQVAIWNRRSNDLCQIMTRFAADITTDQDRGKWLDLD